MAGLAFQRTLNISWTDIKTHGNLMLVFERPSEDKLQPFQNSAAWKVIKVSGNGNGSVTYTGHFGVGAVSPAVGNVVDHVQWTAIRPGSLTQLTKDTNGDLVFSPATAVESQGNIIMVENKTGQRMDLSVGTSDDKAQEYKPTFVFKEVGGNSAMAADFHPILYAFVNQNAKESALITAAIQTKFSIQSINLAKLDAVTDWRLEEDHNGVFTLTPKPK